VVSASCRLPSCFKRVPPPLPLLHQTASIFKPSLLREAAISRGCWEKRYMYFFFQTHSILLPPPPFYYHSTSKLFFLSLVTWQKLIGLGFNSSTTTPSILSHIYRFSFTTLKSSLSLPPKAVHPPSLHTHSL
jgi:hypothetical protein